MKEKITLKDICVDRKAQGFELSAIVNGHRKRRRYLFYSLMEAKREFRDECNSE